MRTVGTLVLSLAFLVALTSSCKKAEREWSPSDHDNADNAGAQAPQPRPAPQPAAQPAASPDTVWASSCAPCHGPSGKADGPMSAALRAPDLSKSKLSEAEIAAVIKNGRGKMPAGNYPQPVIDGLVKKVQSLR